jgi:hypothetical protein
VVEVAVAPRAVVVLAVCSLVQQQFLLAHTLSLLEVVVREQDQLLLVQMV